MKAERKATIVMEGAVIRRIPAPPRLKHKGAAMVISRALVKEGVFISETGLIARKKPLSEKRGPVISKRPLLTGAEYRG
jgi:hypothetical protein